MLEKLPDGAVFGGKDHVSGTVPHKIGPKTAGRSITTANVNKKP